HPSQCLESSSCGLRLFARAVFLADMAILCVMRRRHFCPAATAHGYRIRLQHRVLKLEEQRALASERTRIARDLHDDLGASLTGIALQLEAAQKRGRAEGEQLAELAGEARGVAHDLRELAWTTNPRCDTAVSVVA